jgi:PAS domain S-box-containing protein
MTIDLIRNATLLTTLIVLYGLISRKKINYSFVQQLTNGILFGGIAIVGMNIPITYSPGIFYDGRTIILSLSGVFGGGITTALSVILVLIYRVSIGGPGIWAGSASIITSALIGIVFRRYYRSKPESVRIAGLAVMGIIVHLTMLLSQLLLPWPFGVEVIRKIWMPVLVIFPMTTAVMGAFLRNGLRKILAEESIRKSEVFYRTTLRSIGDAVMTTNQEGDIIFLNPVAEQLTGWSEQEARGKNIKTVFQIVHEDTGQEVDCPVKMALSEGRTVALANHTMLISKQGKKIPIADSGAPIRDESENIIGAVLVFRDQTHERQKQREIRESRERFHTLTEQSPVGIFRTDPNGLITYVNPKWCQLSGLTREQALGNDWLNAVHPDDRESLLRNRIGDIQKDKWSLAQYRFLKDKDETWVLGEAIPEITAEGKFLGYIGTITDVTEQKRAEQALAQSRENFRRSMDESPLGMRILTDAGDTLYMNKALLNIYGYSSIAEYHETPIENRYTKNGIRLHLQRKERRKKGEAVESEYEIEIKRKDGSIRNLHVYRKMLIWDGKEQSLVIYQDYTERKKAEDALIRSENSLKESQEIAQIGSWEYDIAGNTTEWSENCFRLFGLRPGEILPSYDYFVTRVHPEDRYLFDEAYAKIIARNETTSTQFRITFQNSQTKWLLNKIIPEFSNGQLMKLRGMIMDITESVKTIADLEQAKNKAEEGDRLKSAFLANMSHEIRTPLNTILGFSSILASDENISPQEKEEYSSIINRSSDNLLQIINDILDISKLETGQLKIFNTRFDVQNVMDELNRVFMKRLAEIDKNEVQLKQVTTDERLFLNQDRVRFYQIFTNLLSNSIKFTEKGEIRFGVSKVDEETVSFFVSDTGIGIKKELQSAIFERFRQVNEFGTNKVHGGTGLGLSIVKNLVELMGGTITVESESGKGTLFRFTLPKEI